VSTGDVLLLAWFASVSLGAVGFFRSRDGSVEESVGLAFVCGLVWSLVLFLLLYAVAAKMGLRQ
jgi:hypothetical protein